MILPLLLISMLTVGMTATFSGFQTTPARISPSLLGQIAIQGEAGVRVLIETYTSDYSTIVADIDALGGEVHFEFKYAKGLAATLPADSVATLAKNLNVKAIGLDEERTISSIGIPKRIDGTGVSKGKKAPMFAYDMFDQSREELLRLYTPSKDAMIIHLTPEQIEMLEPQTYWNPIAMGAANVWGAGYLGQDSLAVIIDTGVFADHVMLGWYPYGPVIGGIDMSYDYGDPTYGGFDNWRNHWHGTHCAGILAGAAGLLVHSSDPLYQAVARYGTPPPEMSSMGYPGYHLITLFGMAPLAQIYGIKVFDHTGGGVPTSMIIGAIEHAIWMHEEGGYDVDVISMSLGGGTGYDGRDMEAMTVDYATSIGITVVGAAGNEGPASMTVGSPATANTAIAVAAAAHPVNTRIAWDAIYYGIPGIGHQLFTSDTPQIYAFSSRGPTSDGRYKPTISATGIDVVSCVTPPLDDPGSPFWVGWADGTSMACPAVAGAVALLNTWGELNGASPYDYKEAITAGAIWLEGYDEYDQGAGYLNAANSMLSLLSDTDLGTPHPPIDPAIPPSVPVVPRGIDMGIVGSGIYEYTITDLEPGHKVDFYFEATEATDYIEIEIDNVRTVRNPYLMNTFELYVQSAVRTGYDYFIDSANVFGHAFFYIEDYSTTWAGATWMPDGGDAFNLIIQPGYMRVVMENDWTSSGRISGTIKITVTEETTPQIPDEEWSDTISTGEWTGWMWPIGFGSSGVIIEVWWENDWTVYSTSDLDMVIAWNEGAGWNYDVSGASLRSPEGVYISSTDLTAVMMYVEGYETYGVPESYTVRVYYVD